MPSLTKYRLILREAAASPASWNEETREIEAVIASATPVERRDAKGKYLEVLDVNGADLAALRGASVLNSHRQDGLDNVIGVVDSARVEGDQIVARLRLSSRPELAGTVADIGRGIIRNLSIGYSVEQWDEATADGKRVKRAAKWTPREVSFVGVPADRAAHTRSQTMPDIIDRTSINQQIRQLARRAGVAQAVVDDLIDRGADLDEARAALFDDVIKRGSIAISPNGHASLDDPEFFSRTVADGLYCRIDATAKPSEAAREYANASLAEVAKLCLHRAGQSTTGLSADTLITRALQGAGTTSDYANIMMNVLLNKTLRVAYEAAPSGLKEVGRQMTNVDFRARFRIMLDSTGVQLLPVNEKGEFKSQQMVDASESYAVNTFGSIVPLTRKLLVNDDLNAMGDLNRRLGIAAAQFEATTLVNLLISNSGMGPVMNDDSNTLFHTAHGNIEAVVANIGPPSVTSLSSARLAMRHQKGKGGGLINVVPSILVVPAELETTGEKIITEIRPVVVGEVNPFSKLTRLVVEPRLPATAWYVVADPGTIDGLEYAYLASFPGPQIEARLGFQIDGLETRVRLDFGCGFVDWRGWFYNAGA
jgi:hypothetical protein